MLGVLLDVSCSMMGTHALDRSHTVDVEHTHAIFTAVANIVKQEVHHYDQHRDDQHRDDRQESIFVSAFGLKHQATCDLLSLLNMFDSSGHSKLIHLARHRAPHAEKWINYLSEYESQFLHSALIHNEEYIRSLLNLIPPDMSAKSSLKD